MPRACTHWHRSHQNPTREAGMNRIRCIHPIRRITSVLAGLAGASLAFTATPPAAFATRVPPAGGADGQPPPPQVHTIVTGGMPGWQIALIAIGAALVAAALAVLLDRARATRRQTTVQGT
jgi:hypothetical protein